MKAANITDFIEKSINYYMSGEDGESFHIEPPEDLTPEIRNILATILNQIRTIRIPKLPKDISPGIQNTLTTHSNLTNDIKNTLSLILHELQNKSSITSISSSIDDASRSSLVNHKRLVINLQNIEAELKKYNIANKKTLENIKNAISGNDMDKETLNSINASIQKQDQTNNIISSSFKDMINSISRPKKWEFDLQRDGNGYLTKITASEVS